MTPRPPFGEKIVIVADPHVCMEGESPYGIDGGARLQLTVDFINRRHGDASLCVFLGDLTISGRRGEYERLAEISRFLRTPVRFALGNHDDRDAFFAAFREHPRDGAGYVQFIHQLREITCVIADTFQSGNASGWLCEQRLANLASMLDGLRGEQAMLFLHHPPNPIGVVGIDRTALEASAGAELSRIIIASGVRLLYTFCGHTHRTVFSTWAGAPCAAIPSAGHIWPKNFTTAIEAQLYNGPPRLGVAYVSETNVTVHIQDILTASGDWPHRTNRELIYNITGADLRGARYLSDEIDES